MKKGFVSIVLIFAALTLSAQTGVIQELAGTVEIKHPGSAVWETARSGQRITADTTISTGFRSTAVIALGDSLLVLRPLTRFTLKELIRQRDTERVTLELSTGRIRAEVRAPEGVKVDFIVHTNRATTSVRGTIFEFDTVSLTVIEGTVIFSGSASVVPVVIDAGRFTYMDEQSGQAALPEETAMVELKPEPPVGTQAVPFLEQLQITTGADENTVELHGTVSF